MNRLEGDDGLDSNWLVALDRVFPAGIPRLAEWEGIDAIAKVLQSFAAPNTGHMFFPDHGGSDLVAAQRSAHDDEWIELFSDPTKMGLQIFKPRKLRFFCPEGLPTMAHFLLDSVSISDKPEFPKSATDSVEEFAMTLNGKKYTHAEWQEGHDRNDEPLQSDTRRIMRYWAGGQLAIFAKSSPYNRHNSPGFDAYEAEHTKPERFAAAVAAFTEVARKGALA